MVQTFLSIFDSGAWILWPIFLVSVVAWYVGVVKFLQLARMRRARRRFLSLLGSGDTVELSSSTGIAAYDDLLRAARGRQGLAGPVRLFLSDVSPGLERGFSTIATCASAAPLMGLLGTIAGMNEMFTVINEFGYGSPLLMAGAISVALQASLTGLTVAVAAMFLHNYLYGRTASCLEDLTRDCARLATGREPAGA